jgi:hypothetical protein
MLKSERCISCRKGESGPCQLALERIYAIQGLKKKVDSDAITSGCPWYINSSDDNYSFWQYAKTLDAPVSDKEICDLLLIDQATLNASYESALNKLRQLKDTPELQMFKEAVLDKIASADDDQTVYMPDEFRDRVDSEFSKVKNEEKEHDPDAEQFIDKPKKTKGLGMPMHRDGNKVDLYGIYSQKTRDRIQQEKMEAYEKAKKDKQK